MLWELLGLHHLSFHSTLSAFLLCIPLLSNYGPTLLVCLLLLLRYSIKISLLPIPLSSLCLLCIFLHQSSLKIFSLLHLVIKLSSLLRQASWCLLPAQEKILLCLLYNPHFLSPLLSQFEAPCSEMTYFSTVVTPHLSVPVYIHCIGVLS